MKRLACSYVWWLSVDLYIEAVVKECGVCQQSQNHPNHHLFKYTAGYDVHLLYLYPL